MSESFGEAMQRLQSQAGQGHTREELRELSQGILNLASETPKHKTIPGRAYTPEQKRAIIERLYQFWLDASALRLGQLVCVGAGRYHVFSVEDDDLITTLEQVIVPKEQE